MSSFAFRWISSTRGEPEPPVIYTFIFTGAYLFFLFLHETAHVVAGLLLDMACVQVKISFTLSVLMEKRDGSEKTCLEQMFISLAGPLVPLIVAIGGYFTLLRFDVNPASAIFPALILAIGDSLHSLLLPQKHTDGGKAFRALMHVVRGRGQRVFIV